MAVTTTEPGVVPAVEVMGVKLTDLKAMVEAARSIGATRLRIGECEVEIPGEPPPEPEPPALTDKQLEALTKELLGSVPDDNDLLHWSVPGPLPSEASKA